MHEVLLRLRGGAALVGQHHGRGHGVRPRQQRAQRLHARRDALRQRAAHHGVVAAHGHDEADVADGSPLHGQAGQPVRLPLLHDALHGGVGEPVVALAGVAAAAGHGREHDEVI